MTACVTAFVFPGQGSQKIGMLADLAEEFPVIKTTFNQASDVLGYDLWDISQQGSPEAINQTECTQPLLLTASVALWRIWLDQGGVRPDYFAGHSLGEWSALACAEVLRFEDAVKLVRLRGQYMQNAVPAGLGLMAAVMGLDDQLIAEACDFSTPENYVAAVNFNAPGQVVIAGHADAIFKATAHCKEKGAKRVLPLPVSAPFHTPLMLPAAERLAQDIQATEFHAPKIPVLHNVTVATETDPEVIRSLMIQQITAPVPWVKTVERLHSLGVSQIVECGPGKVLGGLNKRICPDQENYSTDTVSSFLSALEAVKLSTQA